MKLLYGDRENVDFAGPIKMTPEQRVRLVQWFRERFACVDDIRVSAGELRGWRLGDRNFMRLWSSCEDEAVLRSIVVEPLEIDELGRRLARGGMSTLMRRVKVMDGFGAVARSVGVDPYTEPKTPEDRAALEKAIEIYLKRRREVEQYGEETLQERRQRLLEKKRSLESQLGTHKLLKGRVVAGKYQARLDELQQGIGTVEEELANLQTGLDEHE